MGLEDDVKEVTIINPINNNTTNTNITINTIGSRRY